MPQAEHLGALPLLQHARKLASSTQIALSEAASAPRGTSDAIKRFGLTRRESEVLLLVAEGLSNRAIADKRVITEKTVSVHVSRILAKLGVDSRAKVVVVAYRLGLAMDSKH